MRTQQTNRLTDALAKAGALSVQENALAPLRVELARVKAELAEFKRRAIRRELLELVTVREWRREHAFWACETQPALRIAERVYLWLTNRR